MGKNIRKTTEEFIEEAKKIHGDKYDYSKVDYKNNKTKVTIICPEHGEFEQRPSDHLQGKGCVKCHHDRNAKNQASTKEEFMEKAIKIHRNKYDYSKVVYVNAHEYVTIICPEHGEFQQMPYSHLNGRGCPKCAGIVKRTTEDFINDARKVHGNKYDYSKVVYKNNKEKVIIICPEHGEFEQSPDKHLIGRGCPECGKKLISIARTDTFDDFLRKAKKVHGDKYDYSKAEYVNSLVKIRITCPTHGDFWQVPSSHLRGVGCPYCRESRLERRIEHFLETKGVNYEKLQHFEWLGKQHLDFFLPEYNTAIECQGRQHFMPVEAFGGKEEFEKCVKRDEMKKQLCKENKVNLIYFADKKYEDNIFTDEEEMFNTIVAHVSK